MAIVLAYEIIYTMHLPVCFSSTSSGAFRVLFVIAPLDVHNSHPYLTLQGIRSGDEGGSRRYPLLQKHRDAEELTPSLRSVSIVRTRERWSRRGTVVTCRTLQVG